MTRLSKLRLLHRQAKTTHREKGSDEGAHVCTHVKIQLRGTDGKKDSESNMIEDKGLQTATI